MKKFFKSFWSEFKGFAFKGNVIDLAVGMIIGAAFTGIVTALVNSILTPILTIFTSATKFEDMVWQLGPITLPYGSFLQAVFNFAATALCLFFLVKGINKLTSLKKKEEAPKKEPARTCPFCFGEIHKDATRCPHCTSMLEIKK